MNMQEERRIREEVFPLMDRLRDFDGRLDDIEIEIGKVKGAVDKLWSMCRLLETDLKKTTLDLAIHAEKKHPAKKEKVVQAGLKK